MTKGQLLSNKTYLPTGKPAGSSHDRRKARRIKEGKKLAFKTKVKNNESV